MSHCLHLWVWYNLYFTWFSLIWQTVTKNSELPLFSKGVVPVLYSTVNTEAIHPSSPWVLSLFLITEWSPNNAIVALISLEERRRFIDTNLKVTRHEKEITQDISLLTLVPEVVSRSCRPIWIPTEPGPLMLLCFENSRDFSSNQQLPFKSMLVLIFKMYYKIISFQKSCKLWS